MSSEISSNAAQGPASRENEDVTLGWVLWRSDAGAHYATRRGSRLTDKQIQTGLVMTLAADTPDELLQLLQEQATLRAE